MTFDIAIINPPYYRNLHLQVLSKMIEKVDFEKGAEVVCLHPDFYDEKMVWNKNKYFNKLRPRLEPYISKVEEVNPLYFNIVLCRSLVFTYMNKKGGFDYDSRRNVNIDIYNKTIKRVIDGTTPKFKDYYDESKQYKIVMPALHGSPNTWCHITSFRYDRAIKVEECKTNKNFAKRIFSFDTEEERHNFHYSLFTPFFMYCVWMTKNSYTQSCIPWLPYMIDYTKPWTHQRFCDHFKISKKESDFMINFFKNRGESLFTVNI